STKQQTKQQRKKRQSFFHQEVPATNMCSRRLTLAGLAIVALLATLAPVPGIADEPARVLLIVGDSISAGYGLPVGTGWVDLLASRIERGHYPVHVVNASVTGDTKIGRASWR